MPRATWPRVLEELSRIELEHQGLQPQPGQPSPIDRYRRGKIAAVEAITRRSLVVYAVACTSPGKPVPPQLLMLDSSDRLGFKTVTETLDGTALDILVHSPGGYADAAESIVQQLRAQFHDIRFIVPSFAKSAATMLVMAGDRILLDRDAELGPIDPQMMTANGPSPAVAILAQFRKAQEELKKDASLLPAWMPILSQFGPSRLVDCENAISHAKMLVKTWTQKYMFAGDADAEAKADMLSEFLGDHANFKSHGRPIKLPELLVNGVRAEDIRANATLYTAVDELYCCLDLLLGNTPVYKIFENSAGEALIRQSGQMMVPMPMLRMQIPQPQPVPPPQLPPRAGESS